MLVLKKTICLLALSLLLVFNVTAAEDFLVFGEQTGEVADVLGMTDKELETFCTENKITYLAVNKDNTKQIRKAEFADEFSKKMVDISVLEDKEILEFSSLISTFESANGKVITHGDKKFLKVELETVDSGGKYYLTQYVTVCDAQKTVLTFYTADGQDKSYIDEIFAQQFPEKTNYKPYIIIGVVLFALMGVAIAVLIIKELRQKS